MPELSSRDVAMRAFVVALVATLASLGIATLLLQGWADLTPGATDIVPLTAFPFLVAGLTTLIVRMTRRMGWWRGPARRWVFGGLLTLTAVVLTAVVSLALMMLFLVLDPPPPGGHAEPVAEALFVTGFVVLLTGLPVWTMLFGVLVGPGGQAWQGAAPRRA